MKKIRTLKTVNKKNNKKGLKIKKVTLTPNSARIKQVDLGNGFRRWDYYETIGGGATFEFTFEGGRLKPISAGWWVGRTTPPLPTTALSYPQGTNNWVVVIRNPTSIPLQAGFFFVTKT